MLVRVPMVVFDSRQHSQLVCLDMKFCRAIPAISSLSAVLQTSLIAHCWLYSVVINDMNITCKGQELQLTHSPKPLVKPMSTSVQLEGQQLLERLLSAVQVLGGTKTRAWSVMLASRAMMYAFVPPIC